MKFWIRLLVIIVAIQGCSVDNNQEEADNLLAAIEKGDFASIKNIVTQNPHLIHEHMHNEYTLLHFAVRQKNKALLLFLLEKGADVNSATKRYNLTPLHDAAAQGHDEIAVLLIDNGADVNARNYFLKTPLHLVCSSLSATAKMVDLLLSHGAEVDARAKRGETPLCIACQWLEEDEVGLEIIRLLLSAGADPEINCFYEIPELSLIHLTLAEQHFKKTQILVDHGAGFDLKTDEGMQSFTVEEVQEMYRKLEESMQKE